MRVYCSQQIRVTDQEATVHKIGTLLIARGLRKLVLTARLYDHLRGQTVFRQQWVEEHDSTRGVHVVPPVGCVAENMVDIRHSEGGALRIESEEANPCR